MKFESKFTTDLTPNELLDIQGGGFWDDVKEFFQDLADGLYDATGCGGRH